MIHDSVELRRVLNGITPQSRRAEAVEVRRRAGCRLCPWLNWSSNAS